MSLKYILIIAVIIVIGLAACGTIREPIWITDPTPVVDATKVDVTRIQYGIAVYHEQRCGVCHALRVANTAGFFAPPHDEAASNAQARIAASAYNGQAEDVEAYLWESLLEPQLYVVPGYGTSQHRMPAYDFLPQSDLEALVYLLLNQG